MVHVRFLDHKDVADSPKKSLFQAIAELPVQTDEALLLHTYYIIT